MTRSQAVKNLSVAIIMLGGGILLLLMSGLLFNPVIQYIIGGVLILFGIGVMGDRNKLPAMIILLVGIALIIIRGFVPGLIGFVGWILVLAAAAIGLMSVSEIRKHIHR